MQQANVSGKQMKKLICLLLTSYRLRFSVCHGLYMHLPDRSTIALADDSALAIADPQRIDDNCEPRLLIRVYLRQMCGFHVDRLYYYCSMQSYAATARTEKRAQRPGKGRRRKR